MTGEITLRGKVLPIRGLEEEVLTAHRSAIETVILPARTEPGVDDVPAELREQMTFRLADEVDDGFEEALGRVPSSVPVGSAAS